MKQFAYYLILSLLVAAGTALTAPAKKAAAKKSGAATARKTTSSKGKASSAKGKASSSTARKRAAAGKKSRYAARTRSAPVQQQPTPDRYREIQQALIDRGYLKTDATGQWSPDSTEALRQFQTDQKLEPTGKLDSLSLIALGLGPKRVADAQARPNDNRSSERN